MQLPQYKKRNVVKLKICSEPGCKKEYYGHPISKYCEIHHDIRNRKRKRRVYEDPSVQNQVIDHKHMEVTEVEYVCAVEGCRNKFRIKLYPKQEVYPKYCDQHRTEHRRLNFLKKSK